MRFWVEGSQGLDVQFKVDSLIKCRVKVLTGFQIAVRKAELITQDVVKS